MKKQPTNKKPKKSIPVYINHSSDPTANAIMKTMAKKIRAKIKN